MNSRTFKDQATLVFDFIKLFRPFLGYFDGILEYFGLYAAPECAGTSGADAAVISATSVPVVEACSAFSTVVKNVAGAVRAVYIGVSLQQ